MCVSWTGCHIVKAIVAQATYRHINVLFTRESRHGMATWYTLDINHFSELIMLDTFHVGWGFFSNWTKAHVDMQDLQKGDSCWIQPTTLLPMPLLCVNKNAATVVSLILCVKNWSFKLCDIQDNHQFQRFNKLQVCQCNQMFITQKIYLLYCVRQ